MPCTIQTGRVAALVPALLLAFAGLSASTPNAQARQAFTFSSTGGGPGGGSQFRAPVATRDVDRYAQLLNLTEEQKASAKSMVEAMVGEFTPLAKETREKMDEIQAEFQESRDPSVFRDKMPAVMGKLRDKRAELEKNFLSDLKLLLTPEQDANWGRLEKLRRRESNTPGFMGLSGESVDLVKVGEKTGVIGGPTFAGAPEQLRSLFEQYENELDKALQEKAKAQADNPVRGGPGRDGPMDPEAMQKAMAAVREKSLGVRDVNSKFAREIQGVLGEGLASKWADEVKKQTFPDVYRESYTSKAMQAALAMGDLSGDQQSALKSIQEQYQHDLEPANEALAKAIADADSSGDRGGMMNGPNGAMMVRMGDEPEAVKKARAAKREMENKTLDKIKSTLTDSQKAKLPAKRERRGPGPGTDAGEDGGEMEIHVMTTDVRN